MVPHASAFTNNIVGTLLKKSNISQSKAYNKKYNNYGSIQKIILNIKVYLVTSSRCVISFDSTRFTDVKMKHRKKKTLTATVKHFVS